MHFQLEYIGYWPKHLTVRPHPANTAVYIEKSSRESHTAGVTSYLQNALRVFNILPRM